MGGAASSLSRERDQREQGAVRHLQTNEGDTRAGSASTGAGYGRRVTEAEAVRAREILEEFAEAAGRGRHSSRALDDRLVMDLDLRSSEKGHRSEDPVISRARRGRYYRENAERILQEEREAYALTEGAARRRARADAVAAGLSCKRCKGPVEVRGSRGRIPEHCGDKCRDATKWENNRDRVRKNQLAAYHRTTGAKLRAARAREVESLRCGQCRRPVKPKRATGRLPGFCGKKCRYRAKYLRGVMAREARARMEPTRKRGPAPGKTTNGPRAGGARI